MHVMDRQGRISRRFRRRVVFVAICALACLFAVSRLRANSFREPHRLTLERMTLIEDALDRYSVDNGGELPSTEQGLRALLKRSEAEPAPINWCGPYLDSHETIFDGWGHKLHYVAPGGGASRRPYDLWSLGSDNASGGTGPTADTKSWEPRTLAH